VAINAAVIPSRRDFISITYTFIYPTSIYLVASYIFRVDFTVVLCIEATFLRRAAYISRFPWTYSPARADGIHNVERVGSWRKIMTQRKLRFHLAAASLTLGIALASPSAFSQNGPSALNFGATSNPQTGSQPVQPTATGRTTFDSAAPQYGADGSVRNGPAGANFSATSNPQTGSQPIKPVTPSPHQHQAAVSLPKDGPAGPAGANFSATSNPQTGR
jgi:hypothetical protein